MAINESINNTSLEEEEEEETSKSISELVRDRGLVPIPKERTIARRVKRMQLETDGKVQPKLINTAHQVSATPFSSGQHTVRSSAEYYPTKAPASSRK